MAKKYVSNGKDVTAYKWVKIIQQLLLIAFGIVLIIFCANKDLQNALGYISASILLVFAILTIGFATIFQKGLLSVENLAGSALVALSVLIYINPSIVVAYIPAFLGAVLLVYSLIFVLDLVVSIVKKEAKVSTYIIHGSVILVFMGLGITALVLTFANDNQETIKMVMMIIVGIIAIICGSVLIFYYAANPKYKVETRTVVTDDGKQITVVSSRNTVYKDEKEKKEKKKKAKQIDAPEKKEEPKQIEKKE